MYEVRSSILHGSDLMQLDQNLASGFDPTDFNEYELQIELSNITRSASQLVEKSAGQLALYLAVLASMPSEFRSSYFAGSAGAIGPGSGRTLKRDPVISSRILTSGSEYRISWRRYAGVTAAMALF